MTTTPDDLRRYLRNLDAERSAVFLYESMAAGEENAQLAAVYRKLAGTERRHAGVWEEKIRAAGGGVPAPAFSLRIRVLGWLARRFGAHLVLPAVAAMETDAGAEYAAQPEPEARQMQPEERSHARIFKMMAGGGQGMEGGLIARFEGRHRSTGGNALRAGVLGANDGLVSNFSLLMGVAGAGAEPKALLITGFAGLLAGAISMALGEWLSVQSARELFANQIAVERDELQGNPEAEREELALIYQAKGMPAEEAEKLASRLLADPDKALDTLAREELGIDPAELGGSAWEAAFTSFLLFAAGAILPVVPFFFCGGMTGVLVSAGVSALGLFGIGAAITLVTGRGVLFSGFRQVLFGIAAAAVTFGIGRLIGVHLG